MAAEIEAQNKYYLQQDGNCQKEMIRMAFDLGCGAESQQSFEDRRSLFKPSSPCSHSPLYREDLSRSPQDGATRSKGRFYPDERPQCLGDSSSQRGQDAAILGWPYSACPELAQPGPLMQPPVVPLRPKKAPSNYGLSLSSSTSSFFADKTSTAAALRKSHRYSMFEDLMAVRRTPPHLESVRSIRPRSMYVPFVGCVQSPILPPGKEARDILKALSFSPTPENHSPQGYNFSANPLGDFKAVNLHMRRSSVCNRSPSQSSLDDDLPARPRSSLALVKPLWDPKNQPFTSSRLPRIPQSPPRGPSRQERPSSGSLFHTEGGGGEFALGLIPTTKSSSTSNLQNFHQGRRSKRIQQPAVPMVARSGYGFYAQEGYDIDPELCSLWHRSSRAGGKSGQPKVQEAVPPTAGFLSTFRPVPNCVSMEARMAKDAGIRRPGGGSNDGSSYLTEGGSNLMTTFCTSNSGSSQSSSSFETARSSSNFSSTRSSVSSCSVALAGATDCQHQQSQVSVNSNTSSMSSSGSKGMGSNLNAILESIRETSPYALTQPRNVPTASDKETLQGPN